MRLLTWFEVLVIILVLLCAKVACAADYHLIDLNELGINYRNYEKVNSKARNLLLFPEHPKESIDVLINLDVLHFGYMDSQIQSLTTSGQYRSIGLDTRLGIRVTEHLQFGYWHRSQHLMDRHHSFMPKFPSEDSIEIRLYLFRSKEKRNGVF